MATARTDLSALLLSCGSLGLSTALILAAPELTAAEAPYWINNQICVPEPSEKPCRRWQDCPGWPFDLTDSHYFCANNSDKGPPKNGACGGSPPVGTVKCHRSSSATTCGTKRKCKSTMGWDLKNSSCTETVRACIEEPMTPKPPLKPRPAL